MTFLPHRWKVFLFFIRNDSYHRYLRHHEMAHADTAPMSRRDFYLREQERKWSGIRRCC